MDERCDVSELLVSQCAHCRGDKDAEEQEDEQLVQMVQSLSRHNSEKS